MKTAKEYTDEMVGDTYWHPESARMSKQCFINHLKCFNDAVKSDSKGLCEVCEQNEAIVSVTYTREWDGEVKGFSQELCVHCYSAQDYQRFLKNCITYNVGFGI